MKSSNSKYCNYSTRFALLYKRLHWMTSFKSSKASQNLSARFPSSRYQKLRAEVAGEIAGEIDKLTKRSEDLELLSERLVEIEAQSELFLLKNSFSIPKLTFLLRTSPCFMHPDILSNYDSILTSTLEKITNVQFTDSSRIQACLPVKVGGLGLPSASLHATSLFLSSASSCAALSDQISTCTGPTGDEETALELWGDTAQAIPPTNRST